MVTEISRRGKLGQQQQKAEIIQFAEFQLLCKSITNGAISKIAKLRDVHCFFVFFVF